MLDSVTHEGKADTTHSLIIQYSDDLLFSLGVSEEQFSKEAPFLLAAKFYELGRLTSGQASRLCGMNRVEFLLSLSRIGVSISNLRGEDAALEIEFLKNH